MRYLLFTFKVALIGVLALVGCETTTLFQSDFDANAVNQPPAPTQKVGRIEVDAPAGSVVVVPAPPGAGGGNWVQIGRPTGPNVSTLQARLSELAGQGQHTFLAYVYMPTGAGTASIQFERVNQAASHYDAFLHLDLLPDNSVRIDDDATKEFGTFPRDEPFLIQVALDIGATEATARVLLSGANASGEYQHTIPGYWLPIAHQFGTVRIWQGFPHTGAFQVTNLLVTRNEN